MTPFRDVEYMQPEPAPNLLIAVTMCLNPESVAIGYNADCQLIDVSTVAIVSDENESLKNRLAELVNQNISSKIINFVEDTINNETNEITKKTIVDNLQRYAEICDSLKNTRTFEAIKGQFERHSPLNDDTLGVIQTQLSDPSFVDNRKQLQNAAYAILVQEQLSKDGIKALLEVITHILDYVEQHQDQSEHVGVIMDNLHWYALACMYYEKHELNSDGFFILKINNSEAVPYPDNYSADKLLNDKNYTQFKQLRFFTNTSDGRIRYYCLDTTISI